MATEKRLSVKKRLIYAEDLFEPVDFTVFQVGGRSGGKTMAMYEQLFRKRVELAPTVDAVEVVHGHKVVRERHRGIAYAMECKICNSKIPSNMPYTEKVEYCSVCGKKLDDTFQNYCPNCGAKMDLEVTDHGN